MSGETEIGCKEIAQLLGDYLDGTLPRQQAELLEWHIEACPPCVAFINTYKGTINAARKLCEQEVQIPSELKNRLIGFLKQQPPQPR
jgi:anti-sigma factor (TIGR02949 family)